MLIIAFGIPHGALDHILFFKKRNTSQVKFYSIYLGLVLFFILLWIYYPTLSLTLFLIISAFHFGESQFEDIDIKKYSNSLLLYLVWGLSLLIYLIFYNVDELNVLTALFKDTESFYDVSMVIQNKNYEYEESMVDPDIYEEEPNRLESLMTGGRVLFGDFNGYQ